MVFAISIDLWLATRQDEFGFAEFGNLRQLNDSAWAIELEACGEVTEYKNELLEDPNNLGCYVVDGVGTWRLIVGRSIRVSDEGFEKLRKLCTKLVHSHKSSDSHSFILSTFSVMSLPILTLLFIASLYIAIGASLPSPSRTELPQPQTPKPPNPNPQPLTPKPQTPGPRSQPPNPNPNPKPKPNPKSQTLNSEPPKNHLNPKRKTQNPKPKTPKP
ncbi:uncharacterized protein LOC114277795 [Camellia sinensis]|uniref:uncharacterized protein LOC114277795 n=1 Tax=Camellia sinensis TaxID=4442 RepID=UPI001036EE4C|nr:uncharacterized protein LOC114277795 [Camellia sinensis]